MFEKLTGSVGNADTGTLKDDGRATQMELIECFTEPFDFSGFQEPEGFDDIWYGFQGSMASGDRPYGYLEGMRLIGKTNLIRGFASRISEGRCIKMLKGREVVHVMHEATAAEETPESEALEEYVRRFGGRDCAGYVLYMDDLDAEKRFLTMKDLAIPVIAEIRNDGTVGVINLDEFAPQEHKGIIIAPDPKVSENVSIMRGIVNGEKDHYLQRYGAIPSDGAVEVITKMMLVKSGGPAGFRPANTALIMDNFMGEYSSEHEGSPSAEAAYRFAEKDFDINRETIDSVPEVYGEKVAADDDDDGDDGLVFKDRADLLERLKTQVIGQDKALESIVAPLVRRKAGLGDTDRPIASLMLAGPSGVGKTETAKALASAAFGDPEAFKRIDCGEMVNEMGVSRLLGSSQGYAAFDAGGELSNFISDHPHSVILFDEIEKADDRFYDSLFLQLMSAGRITGSVRSQAPDGSAKGTMRTVDARGCIIIMTSNIGSQSVGENGMSRTGFGGTQDDDELLEDGIADQVRKHFRVEFINRLDGLVVFHPLDRESLSRVFMLKWKPNEERIHDRRGVVVDMDKSVPGWFADLSRKDMLGARNLIRAMDDKLINPMADIMLERKDKGGTLHVSVSKDGKELDIS